MMGLGPPRRVRAFTLIEMLVVMGIIGILVALLYPTIRGVRLAGERAEAQRAVKAIETAMLAYWNDYGRFPLQESAAADKQYTGLDYTNLIAALRGLSAKWNPKNMTYLDVSDKQLTSGRLTDPWDSDYVVWADWNNDRQISAGPYGPIQGRSVLVWSKGPDRSDATASNRVDDIRSWGD